MHFSVGNANKSGDVAVQIEQRVHLDGTFGFAELGPGKQREAKIDRSRVPEHTESDRGPRQSDRGCTRAARWRSGRARNRRRSASPATRWSRPMWSVPL